MEDFFLEKIIVGMFGTNSYLIGSQSNNEVYIIDPGAQADLIIGKIRELNAKPIGIILTHGHPDHTGALKELKTMFNIPLLYNKKEYKNPILIEANHWLKEGDTLNIGNITLHILETGGHSPGGISLYTKDITSFRGNKYDGIIFTGDLIFRRSIGRTDLVDGNRMQLFENIFNKIIYNPEFTESFLILAGHMGLTTIGEEKRLNPFGKHFLKERDWKQNKYYNRELRDVLNSEIEDRP